MKLRTDWKRHAAEQLGEQREKEILCVRCGQPIGENGYRLPSSIHWVCGDRCPETKERWPEDHAEEGEDERLMLGSMIACILVLTCVALYAWVAGGSP